MLNAAKPLFLFIFGIIAVCTFNSCGGKQGIKAISEGIIEYDVHVVDKSHPMAGLAPSTMTMFFKDNMYCSEMSTMGMFSSRFVANPVNHTFTTMVKVLNDKNACIEDAKEIKADIEAHKLILDKTTETKIIAGYKCYKVNVTSVADPTYKFTVYYTEELNVRNPNYSTPYEDLNGLVLQFRLEKFGMEMEFTAKSIRKEDVPDEIFELPGYYKVITKQEMSDIFKFI